VPPRDRRGPPAATNRDTSALCTTGGWRRRPRGPPRWRRRVLGAGGVDGETRCSRRSRRPRSPNGVRSPYPSASSRRRAGTDGPGPPGPAARAAPPAGGAGAMHRHHPRRESLTDHGHQIADVGAPRAALPSGMIGPARTPAAPPPRGPTRPARPPRPWWALRRRGSRGGRRGRGRGHGAGAAVVGATVVPEPGRGARRPVPRGSARRGRRPAPRRGGWPDRRRRAHPAAGRGGQVVPAGGEIRAVVHLSAPPSRSSTVLCTSACRRCARPPARAVGVTDRPGHDLGGARAVAVDQHHQRHAGAHRLVVGAQRSPRRVAALGGDHPPCPRAGTRRRRRWPRSPDRPDPRAGPAPTPRRRRPAGAEPSCAGPPDAPRVNRSVSGNRRCARRSAACAPRRPAP